MSEFTGIAWCDSTVNFWSGCTKVSPGCEHCYAEELSKRFGGIDLRKEDCSGTIGQWGPGAPRKVHDGAFKLAHRLNKKPWVCDRGCELTVGLAFGNECGCGGTLHRRRIFSLSLGDIMDPEVPIPLLARALDKIRQCPDVDWLLLSKRWELWRERVSAAADHLYGEDDNWLVDWLQGVAPRNVWIIASAEDQQRADERIPELLNIPAVVRGLSLEPLLGPINIFKHCDWCGAEIADHDCETIDDDYKIDWVIVGGESGPKARPCNIEWVRSIKDQCAAAGVDCFVKQLGSNPYADVAVTSDHPVLAGMIGVENRKLKLNHSKGGDPTEWPEDLRVRQWPQSKIV